jgi:hypothetical protein
MFCSFFLDVFTLFISVSFLLTFDYFLLTTFITYELEIARMCPYYSLKVRLSVPPYSYSSRFIIGTKALSSVLTIVNSLSHYVPPLVSLIPHCD